MTLNEINENTTVSLTETGGADGQINFDTDAEIYTDSECEDRDICESDREEYERLIKTKYKDFFAADAQRLINRRFKKYRALEEKVRALEESAKSLPDIDALLAAERERAVRETEERMNRSFKANRERDCEIATLPRTSSMRPDVTKLTKDERAKLASRALRGEKISF